MAQPGNLQRLPRLIGAKIRLTSEEGEYVGVIASASTAASKVVLEKVKSSNNEDGEMSLSGLISFSFDEIINFECIDLPELQSSLQDKSKKVKNPAMKSPPSHCGKLDILKKHLTGPQDNPSESQTNVTAAVPDLAEVNNEIHENEKPESLWDQCFMFKNHQYEIPSKQRPDQYVVVNFIDDFFYEAIKIIQNQSVIGCGFDGISLGRYGQLDWIEVATKDLVILFDMQTMDPREAFNAGLSDILTSEVIMKVVHDCRQVSDLLHHQFDIYLVNVFDTQVADVMVQRALRYGRIPKYVRNLAVCLKDYLALSTEQIAFYEVRKYALEHNNNTWHQRPLPPFLLEAAALNVRYLRELRSATLEKILEEFTFGVDIFLSAVRDAKIENCTEHHGELLPDGFSQLDYPTMIRSRYTDDLSQVLPSYDVSQMSVLTGTVEEDCNLHRKISDISDTGNDCITQSMSCTVSPVLHNEIKECDKTKIENDNFDNMPALEEIISSSEEDEELDSSVKCQKYLDGVSHMNNTFSSSGSCSKPSKIVSIYDKLSQEIESFFTSKSTKSQIITEYGLNQSEKYNSTRNLNSYSSKCSNHSDDVKSNAVDLAPSDTILAAPKTRFDAKRISGLNNTASSRTRINIIPAGYHSIAKPKV